MLFIVGTVALVLSFLVAGSVLAGAAEPAQVAEQRGQVAVGVMLLLLPGFALAMVPIVFWPVGKRYDETLAMGYVVFRGRASLAVQEMVLAVRLIANGFDPSAVTAEPADDRPRWRAAVARPVSAT